MTMFDYLIFAITVTAALALVAGESDDDADLERSANGQDGQPSRSVCVHMTLLQSTQKCLTIFGGFRPIRGQIHD